MMDTDTIDGALHEISMMVLVLLDAVETLQGTDTTPRLFQMPYEAGEMLSFGAFDIDKRVKALREAVCPAPAESKVLVLVRDPA